MSVAGLKKQFHKATQGIFLSHKIAEKPIAKYEANSPVSEVDMTVANSKHAFLLDCHKYRQYYNDDEEEAADVVCLDFSNVLDTIPHSTVLEKDRCSLHSVKMAREPGLESGGEFSWHSIGIQALVAFPRVQCCAQSWLISPLTIQMRGPEEKLEDDDPYKFSIYNSTVCVLYLIEYTMIVELEMCLFYRHKQLSSEGKKVSEKVGGAEGTKLDDDFKEMERKVDVTSRAVMEIMAKTIEYLQPNPASRAKLSMINTMSKIRGQEKGPGYPQAEALLADAMLKFGRELGEECNFGPALVDVGEAMKELSEVKDSLDMEVKQNFIDPLQNLHDKDLREIQHHLKKMEGRRLDFDYKKKRQGKLPDEELRQALEKFDESKEIAESSMFNLLEMDIEQVSQLSALVQAQLEYHKQATQILQRVTSKLEDRIKEASSQPRREYQPKPRMSLDFSTGDNTQHNGGISHATTPKPSGVHMDQPCCRALYDFEPENEGELGFKEGDIITLTNQIDENWYEGMLHGQSGFFPINYVDILVPLPN
ncbi:hypothetical protein DUI87_03913 [Hirundo rustica rustica]|uniref:SH3 domain-containing protein n=4 Tax=Passeriformes TaxID=9126 RepID=A0A3M0L1L0_HIRRU|nr:hypothetical protein DUI87_03913 [Hirundo rustica rustica]